MVRPRAPLDAGSDGGRSAATASCRERQLPAGEQVDVAAFGRSGGALGAPARAGINVPQPVEPLPASRCARSGPVRAGECRGERLDRRHRAVRGVDLLIGGAEVRGDDVGQGGRAAREQDERAAPGAQHDPARAHRRRARSAGAAPGELQASAQRVESRQRGWWRDRVGLRGKEQRAGRAGRTRLRRCAGRPPSAEDADGDRSSSSRIGRSSKPARRHTAGGAPSRCGTGARSSPGRGSRPGGRSRRRSRSVSASSRRASCIRRSVIHCCTVRPVRRPIAG